MSANQKTALEELRNKVVVAAELRCGEIFKEYGLYPPASHTIQEGDQYEKILNFNDNFRPTLEAALEDRYPSSEDFGREVDWHEYPLEGVILHRLGNLRLWIESALTRNKAVWDRYLPGDVPYKRSWIKDKGNIPYVKKFLEDATTEALERLGGAK